MTEGNYVVWVHDGASLGQAFEAWGRDAAVHNATDKTPTRVRAVGPNTAARVFVAGLGVVHALAVASEAKCSIVVCVAKDGHGEVHMYRVTLGLTVDLEIDP